MHSPTHCIVLLLFLGTVFGATENCTVWGIRLFFGKYYTRASSDHNLYIGFNTDVHPYSTQSYCKSSYLVFNQQRITCNATEVYIQSTGFLSTMHTCTISGLDYNGKNYYSATYQVVGMDANGTQTPRQSINIRLANKKIREDYKLLLLGDWGLLDDNGRKIYYDVVPRLQNLDLQAYSAVIFLGDLAYDFCDQINQTGPQKDCSKYALFMKGIEFLTSRLPFMITVGNHEYGSKRILSHQLLEATFMGGDNLDMYSFELGSAHFQTVNFFNQTKNNDTSGIGSKIDWLWDDNNKKSDTIDWVVPFGHYPLYCSNYINDTGCSSQLYNKNLKPFITYMNQANISLYLGAHIHLYRRSRPVDMDGNIAKSEVVHNGPTTVYQNPSAPIIVIEGSAGNNYYVELGEFPLQSYTDIQVVNTGFSVMTVFYSSKKIQIEHFLAKDGSLTDSFAIEFTQPEWIVVVILVVGCVAFVGFLGYLLWKSRKPRVVDNALNNSQTKLSESLV